MSTAGLTGAGVKAAVIAIVGSAYEAVDATGAAAWRGVRAVLVGVRGIPRRQRAGRTLVRPHAVRVANLRHEARGARRPVAAGEAGHQHPVGGGSGEHVVFDRRGRSCPLTVDPLASLVEEEGSVARSRVELRE